MERELRHVKRWRVHMDHIKKVLEDFVQSL